MHVDYDYQSSKVEKLMHYILGRLETKPSSLYQWTQTLANTV